MTEQARHGWIADNGNGTFSNPLFYDEFSDPDMIRVGDDYYLTGTTMHAMPGLPILHSRDLVNWTLLGYACDRLDLGPQFRLESGEIYGQGIWAPSFRYHDGTFYIFTNVNGQTTQLFRATDPAGPWTRTALDYALHDLSVLFDDDGKVYVIWGYQDLKLAELSADLTALVPGSERTIIPADAGMGEGVHFLKIDGTYYIFSAWFSGRMRMPCARAAAPAGPYEVNPAISADESFGLAEGARLRNPATAPPFEITPANTADNGRMALHQGAIVDTPAGEWWGFSMMDANSVGRLTCLSPITWHDGWPYFGLPGNLGRTPRIWTKPNTGFSGPPAAPFLRDDAFAGPQLNPVWQWNHAPDDARWSLAERPGHLRLHALPAPDFWQARNTLTQRAVGPQSIATVELDVAGCAMEAVAGLALLNLPYAMLGVRRTAHGLTLEQYDQATDATARVPLAASRVWLRASCDFLQEQAAFSYSTDGAAFQALGGAIALVYQLKTFQGVRYALFHYATGETAAGYADFTSFMLDMPYPRGLMRSIPVGERIALCAGDTVLTAPGGVLVAVPDTAAPASAYVTVVDRGLGRVALKLGDGFVSVAAPGAAGQVTVRAGEPTASETFQWTETLYGDLMLLSLATHRYLRALPDTGTVSADHSGPHPDRHDGSCWQWTITKR